ncbi:MAG: erythromycin esterase family protein [Proteobacteria bacterium]|nr:erythromycin esterase family protein [Pseudomonadota bacterium]
MTHKSKLFFVSAFLWCKLAFAESGVFPLDGQNFDWSDEQLKPLVSMAQGADILAIGESSHGSEGFHRARSRVLRFMVENMGVRMIGFEHPWEHTVKANEFTTTGKGTASEAMSDFSFFIWKSDAVEELLNWLFTYNQNHPNDQVTLFGFDIKNQAVRDFQ